MNSRNMVYEPIVVTGANGFLGGYVLKTLHGKGYRNIFTFSRKEFDLRKLSNINRLLKTTQPATIIHLAGDVGGIGYNLNYPATLFYDNLIMGIQLMEEARKKGIKKFISVGTICAYPKFTPVPFKEDDIWKGYPEETNAAYGLAKKMLLVQAQKNQPWQAA
ncbi:MAG: NAD-dependent epimerase/dehydratase family protein [Candidatus Omnitrophica bacterium]|nr:NAD-dependent epimerase/dehydratase family protein [Candidatus Omnitrophota bacterium]